MGLEGILTLTRVTETTQVDGHGPKKNALNSCARCVYILSSLKNQIIMETLEEQKGFPDLSK